ncbi:DUF3048 domain-containing protein [Galbitalea sp. SE-J8]|uniref:DUF3048 domain-containing protein n=1 Tax=Galbitalea sp. SE-J8 TaxID=3054952 RepID=UPI00259CC39E|nr:DUF3048 domain-containing protein [Galbitalea sp. SE-J8]MDM4763741.1 DUF3048 domain-containing protein [Galbitalea sp. SE-J8]
MTSPTSTPRRLGPAVGTFALLAASALVLGACSSPSPAATSPAPTSAAPSEPSTPEPVQTYTAPLTGLPVDAPITNPSIASKIDNLQDARPQIGLQDTDLVFEELVEGGLTRYIAVWQSHIPETYGPVRSIRGMDPAIVSPLGGLITYSGGQPIFVKGIKDTKVVNVSDDQYGGDKSLFHRTSAKRAPHNLLASGQNIVKRFGDGVAAPSPQFQYAADPATSTASTAGTPTTSISPTFSPVSHPTWEWNTDLGLWVRFQSNGAKDVDDAGKQLRAVNVVTLKVKLKTISHTPVSQLIGSNKATVSTNGHTIDATYTKDSLTDPITLTDAAGSPILLAPGNTWIELVATGGDVSYK